MKASFHKRLQQLEEVRAREAAADRSLEEEEEYRICREKLIAGINAYIEEHGMPEEPPDGGAMALQNLRRELMERAGYRYE